MGTAIAGVSVLSGVGGLGTIPDARRASDEPFGTFFSLRRLSESIAGPGSSTNNGPGHTLSFGRESCCRVARRSGPSRVELLEGDVVRGI
jgi:hypothetical protein